MVTKQEADYDVVIPKGRAEDGVGVDVYRFRPEGMTVETFYAAKDGQAVPPGKELLRIHRRGSLPVGDVETVYSSKAEPAAVECRSGPPVVVSDAYREGWEAIFGQRRPESGEVN